MSKQLDKLKKLLATFTSLEDRAAASSECQRFLKKIEVQAQNEDQAGQALFAAMQSRNRKELEALAELSNFPMIREGASNMAEQIKAKTTPVNRWPTL